MMKHILQTHTLDKRNFQHRYVPDFPPQIPAPHLTREFHQLCQYSQEAPHLLSRPFLSIFCSFPRASLLPALLRPHPRGTQSQSKAPESPEILLASWDSIRRRVTCNKSLYFSLYQALEQAWITLDLGMCRFPTELNLIMALEVLKQAQRENIIPFFFKGQRILFQKQHVDPGIATKFRGEKGFPDKVACGFPHKF